MFRWATYNDIPALMQIRKICFGEEEDYSAFYFATRFTENNTLVYIEQNTPVASLTLLDAEVLTADGQVFPVAYIYSVATLPEWRCRGLAAALSNCADKHLQAQGVAASLLVPSTVPLFDYYAKLGYETKFFIEKNEVVAMGNKIDMIELWEISAGEYFRLRKEAYSAGGYYVQWDEAALNFAIEDCRLSGGLPYYLRKGKMEGFFLAYPMTDDTVLVKESWLRGDLYNMALYLLQEAYGKHKKIIFYHSPTAENATMVPFGMIKYYTKAALPLQGNIPYFGLAKD